MQNNEQQLLSNLKNNALDFPLKTPDDVNWHIIKKSLPKQQKKVLSHFFPTGFAASILIFMFTVAFHSAHNTQELNQLVLKSQKLEQELRSDINYMHDELLRWHIQKIDKKLAKTFSVTEKKLLWQQRVNLLTTSTNKAHVNKVYI